MSDEEPNPSLPLTVEVDILENYKKFIIIFSLVILVLTIVTQIAIKQWIVCSQYRKRGHHSNVTHHALFGRCDFMMNTRFDYKNLAKKNWNNKANAGVAETRFIKYLTNILNDKQELYRCCQIILSTKDEKAKEETEIQCSLRPSTGLSMTIKKLRPCKQVVANSSKSEKREGYRSIINSLLRIKSITHLWLVKMNECPATNHMYEPFEHNEQQKGSSNHNTGKEEEEVTTEEVKIHYDISRCLLNVNKNLFTPIVNRKMLKRLFNDFMGPNDVFTAFESYSLLSALFMPWSLMPVKDLSKIDSENIMECINTYGDWFTDAFKVKFDIPKMSAANNNKKQENVEIIISLPDALKDLIKQDSNNADGVKIKSTVPREQLLDFRFIMHFAKDYSEIKKISFNHLDCLWIGDTLCISHSPMEIVVDELAVLIQEGDNYEVLLDDKEENKSQNNINLLSQDDDNYGTGDYDKDGKLIEHNNEESIKQDNNSNSAIGGDDNGNELSLPTEKTPMDNEFKKKTTVKDRYSPTSLNLTKNFRVIKVKAEPNSNCEALQSMKANEFSLNDKKICVKEIKYI